MPLPVTAAATPTCATGGDTGSWEKPRAGMEEAQTGLPSLSERPTRCVVYSGLPPLLMS